MCYVRKVNEVKREAKRREVELLILPTLDAIKALKKDRDFRRAQFEEDKARGYLKHAEILAELDAKASQICSFQWAQGASLSMLTFRR